MNSSTITTRRLTTAVVMAFAMAALIVPTASANVTSKNIYGSLDPWAYRAIHHSQTSMPLLTEHSAGQKIVADPIADATRLVTANSAGQNSPKAAHSAAVASVPQAATSSHFDWSDAGIGAGGTLGLVLVAGAGMLALRKRHALAHA